MSDVHERILNALAQTKRSLKIKEISELTGLDPHTVARNLDVLEVLGRVRKLLVGPAKKYLLIESIPVSGLIDISSDLIIILDQARTIQYVNQKARQFLNLDENPILGEPLSMLNLDIFSDPAIIDGLTRFTLEKVYRDEISIIREEKTCWYAVSIIGLSLSINTQSIAVIAEDITERREIQNTLRENEERLSSLARNIPGIVFRHDLVMQSNEFFNDTIEEITGYSKQHVTSRFDIPLYSIIVPEDRIGLEQVMYNALVSKKEYTVEYRVRQKNGGTLIFHERGKTAHDAEGVPRYIDGIIFDITELKLTENKLRETQKRSDLLSRLLETSSQPFVAAYPDGTLFLWNIAYEKLTGYSGDELKTLNLFQDLTPDHWRKEQQKRLKSLRNSNNTTRYEREYVRKDGSIIPVEILVHLEEGDADNPSYYYGFVTDVSTQKRNLELISRSETRYRTLFESAPIPISEDDFSGFLRYVNLLRASGVTDFKAYLADQKNVLNCLSHIKNIRINSEFLQILGIAGEPESLRSLIPHLTDISILKIAELLYSCIKGNLTFKSEIPFRTKKGHQIILVIHASVMPGCETDYSRVIITGIDITYQIRIRDELERSKRNLQAIFDNTLSSFVLIDRNYQVVAYNALASERSELIFERKMAIGDSIWDYVRDSEKERFHTDFARALSGEKIRAELPFPSADGRNYWFEFHFSPVYDESGSINQVFLTAQDITDQKLLEEAFRRSEADRLRLAEEAAKQGMYEINLVTGEVLFSAMFCEMLGYKPGTFSKTTDVWPVLIHPDDIALLDTKRRNNPPNATNFTYEYRMRHQDGSWRWVEATSRIIEWDQNGSPSRVIGVQIDISTRKQAEEELRTSEERLRRIADATDESFLMHHHGIVREANSSACMLFGYSRDELIGMHVTELAAPGYRQLIKKYLANRSEGPYEAVGIRKDGTHIAGVIRSRDIQFANETMRLTAIRDISESNRIREELTDTEERFQSLVKYSPEGIILVNEEGFISEWNHGMEKITGISSQIAIAKKFQDIFPELMPPDHRNNARVSRITRTVRQALKTGVSPIFTGPIEAEIVRTDGTPCQIQQVAFPIRTKKGFRIGSIIHDTTISKKAEADLHRINQELRDAYELIAASEEKLRIKNDELMQKQLELQKSEDRLKLKLDHILSPDYDIREEELANIINVKEIQTLMDKFFEVTGIGMAITDLHGKILVATGWQDICTQFHRVNPESRENCIASDRYLTQDLRPGEIREYFCKNNLRDTVTPIYIGPNHVGNLFLGQFFYDDEQPDISVFISQAAEFGFETDAYLAALSKVPRWNRERVKIVLDFYSQFASIISQMGYTNIKLAKTLSDYQGLATHAQHQKKNKRR